AVKILAFSAIAAAPLILLRPAILAFFGKGASRFVSAGLPLLAETLAFGAVGIACLVLAKDPVAMSVARRFAKKAKKGGSRKES
ncbi:MAG: hypothetical protein Q8M76_03950, partial [Spirochaetaceae bacterium]|nr:hypothetical protein [Spirochaetaceae bacterium]